MESFDKQINNLYDDEQHDIGADLSWDSVNSDVYDRLGQLRNESKRKRRFLILLFAGLLLIPTVYILLNIEPTNQTSQNTNVHINQPVTTENTSDHIGNPAYEVISDKEDIQTDDINIKAQSNDNTNKAITQNKSTRTSNRTTENNDLSSYPDNNLNFNNTTNTITKETVAKMVVSNENANTDKINAETLSKIDSGKIEKGNPGIDNGQLNTSDMSQADRLINTRSMSIINPQKLQYQRLLEELNIIPNKIKEVKKKQSRFQLNLYAGINSANGKYDDIINRNEHNEWLLGHTEGTDLSYQVNSKWGISIGYNHTLINQKFQLQETDSITQKYEDVVIRRLTNAISGSVISEERGDVAVKVLRTRNNLKYNAIHFHSIALGTYYTHSLSDRFVLRPSLSINYNILSAGNGRNIDREGEIFEYTTAESIYKSTSVSASLGLRLEYLLTDHISVGLGIHSTQILRNISSESNESLRLTLLQGRIGLGYRF